jgi:hypothetical protein
VKIMQFATLKYARSAIVVAGLAVVGALTGSAQADVITTSATLPLIGVPYTSPSGAGCFTLAGVCVTPGTFVQTLPVSSMISMGNQLIVTGATYDASLTTVGGTVPIGSVALTGTVDETVFGRTSLTETGTLATELTGLSLMGILTFVNPNNPLNGDTVVATLGSTPSTGSTTITPLQRQEFRISSFFDVFIDVSIPGTIFSKSVGPILVVAVPEPSTWAMLLIGFAGLGFAALRRAARSA